MSGHGLRAAIHSDPRDDTSCGRSPTAFSFSADNASRSTQHDRAGTQYANDLRQRLADRFFPHDHQIHEILGIG